MADKTKIEWTDSTWNVITGCSPVSPGCANCYAAQLAGTRLKHHPSRAGLTKVVNGLPTWTGEVRFNEQWLDQPLRWKKPRRIFVCAHGDLFHEKVQDEWLDKIFSVMAQATQHTFQVLTKRPERMLEYLKTSDMATGGFTYRDSTVIPNVWLGVTAENQEQANRRIPLLIETPAAKRFVSIEPMIGPVDLTDIRLKTINGKTKQPDSIGLNSLRPTMLQPSGVMLDWVICGGESGNNARPMHSDWVRSLRDQCKDAEVPFFFKQWGELWPYEQGQWVSEAEKYAADPYGRAEFCKMGKKYAGRLLDGEEYLEVPE